MPAMIRVPGKYLGEGSPQRTDLPASNIDVAPTVLDLAGAEPCIAGDDCRRLDGRSLLDALDPADAVRGPGPPIARS